MHRSELAIIYIWNCTNKTVLFLILHFLSHFHYLANIRLQQTFVFVKAYGIYVKDVFEVPSKCLQSNIFLFFKTSCRCVCKSSSWRYLEEEVLKTRQKASWKHVLKTTWKMKHFYTEDVFETSSRRIGKHEMFHGQMFVVFIQFSAQERLFFLKKRLVILLRIFKNDFEIFNMCCFRKHF